MTGLGTTRPASGRWSARVANQGHEPTEDAALGQISAPESVTSLRGELPSAVSNGAGVSAAERTTPKAAGRITRGQAERIGRSLSDRDRAILASLDAHRFLTTAQIERFHFSGHVTPSAAARICRRVLHRLHRLQVIDHLERRVGGIRAGSASYVWRVGLAGDRLLRLESTDQPRGRRKEPSLRWLEHCLAVADSHLALRDLAATGRIELLQVQTEPACWRSYLALGGSRDTLKPDLYAVTASGDYEDHWFIEVDRATESLPVLIRQCQQYETYRRTGAEQHARGVFPLVVWVVPDQARADKLAGGLAASRSLGRDLYRICTPAALPDVITGGAA